MDENIEDNNLDKNRPLSQAIDQFNDRMKTYWESLGEKEDNVIILEGNENAPLFIGLPFSHQEAETYYDMFIYNLCNSLSKDPNVNTDFILRPLIMQALVHGALSERIEQKELDKIGNE